MRRDGKGEEADSWRRIRRRSTVEVEGEDVYEVESVWYVLKWSSEGVKCRREV